MQVHEFTDYKDFLRAVIRENQGFRGYQSLLAKESGCQGSFLSQVIHADHHLTRDHAAEMARFWNFSDGEVEYFVTLVDLARAGSSQLKGLMERKLSSLRQQRKTMSDRLAKPRVEDVEAQANYYSSWIWSAVHVGVSVPKLNTAQALANRLQLPLELIKHTLAQLEQFGMVERRGIYWKIGKRDLHLPEKSVMSEMNHANWRQRAIVDVQKKSSASLHYTSVFTVSRKDAELLREHLTRALLEMRERIVASPEEEIYCVSCDFFEA